jgi:hypothetical protein
LSGQFGEQFGGKFGGQYGGQFWIKKNLAVAKQSSGCKRKNKT